MFTTFDPMRPLPPMTTIFIILFSVSDVLSFIMTTASLHYRCLAKRFSVAHEKQKVPLGLIQLILGSSPFFVRSEGRESTREARRPRTAPQRSTNLRMRAGRRLGK